jgi:hypothetical protein
VVVKTRRPSLKERKSIHPFPENFIDDDNIQPYIHNCIVTVHERHNSYQFMVFFKRHRHIRPNNTLYKLTGGRPNLKGDVIVMRIGSSSSYVNMRDRDTILTDWFMQRYGIGPCYRLPLTVCRFCSSALLKKRCLPKFLTYHKN